MLVYQGIEYIEQDCVYCVFLVVVVIVLVFLWQCGGQVVVVLGGDYKGYCCYQVECQLVGDEVVVEVFEQFQCWWCENDC